MATVIDKELLAKIRGSLKRGQRDLISAKTGLTRNTVYACLHGSHFNDSVIKAALEIIERNKQEEAEYEKMISVTLGVEPKSPIAQ